MTKSPRRPRRGLANRICITKRARQNGVVTLEARIGVDGEKIGWADIARRTESTIEIMSLYVEREYRQQGIGKLLVGAAVEWARACCGVARITLNSANRAETFWRRMGFKNAPADRLQWTMRFLAG